MSTIMDLPIYVHMYNLKKNTQLSLLYVHINITSIIFVTTDYKVAKIRVNPTHTGTTVCPIPQNNAYKGGI